MPTVPCRSQMRTRCRAGGADDLRERGLDAWRIEQGVSEGCISGQRRNRPQVIANRAHSQRRDARDERPHLIDVARLFIVVDQRHQFDRCAIAEPLQGVIRAQAIAAIGSVGEPMGQKQDAHVYADRPSLRSRNTRAGTPPAITRSAIGLVTTAPAPTTAPFPTSAITTAALPIHAPAPMRTGDLLDG